MLSEDSVSNEMDDSDINIKIALLALQMIPCKIAFC
jgi:hypothetical protein